MFKVQYLRIICLLAFYFIFVNAKDSNDANTLKSLNSTGASGNKKKYTPDIHLFYESLCPPCREFYYKYFSKLVQLMASYLEIHIYPYGKAKMFEHATGIIEFECHHGKEECYGNKLHACALDIAATPAQGLLFVGCLMEAHHINNGSDDAAADECRAKIDINVESIKECAKGVNGSRLLKYHGMETKRVKLEKIPHVVLNGVRWKGDPENFINDVCATFVYPPKQCQGFLPKAITDVI